MKIGMRMKATMLRLGWSAGLLAAAAAAFPAAGSAQESPGMLVSGDWLAENLERPDVAILHLANDEDGFREGHIPGARLLRYDDLAWDGEQGWRAELREPSRIQEALRGAGVDEGDFIVVYSPSALGAARAWMTLDVMGLGDRLGLLDGGFGGWREDGHPVSTEPSPEVSRGTVTLSPRDDVIVSADWILERLDDPSLALVDARPDDEYTGEDGGMGGMANPGHIPGAHHLYWEELVESRQVPRLHDRETLARLYREAGADLDDTVVTYCMIGLRASMTYFTARYLGYDAKFYDGSWHDWGTRDDLPTVTGRDPR
jgi:thiosulfate/3-mercaptopyruvate sulfurtransferase